MYICAINVFILTQSTGADLFQGRSYKVIFTLRRHVDFHALRLNEIQSLQLTHSTYQSSSPLPSSRLSFTCVKIPMSLPSISNSSGRLHIYNERQIYKFVILSIMSADTHFIPSANAQSTTEYKFSNASIDWKYFHQNCLNRLCLNEITVLSFCRLIHSKLNE